ncbi:Kelch repeat-containing protein [Flavobacterium sp. 245]|uniref:Kelch repeat-containing protein n=1 Tax=Flavobacterium sp. 245 TaxID=2512115 RepID=UPI00105D13AC|nr:carboxypeptidase-like regulatory domain-containing protein [Flavobacterium sp. 245]TDO94548.1 Kelch motif protein [Flavobacterium sp. 245]
MKKLLLIFLLFPLISEAQNLKGIVFSENNTPLENVNILATSSKTGTITNNDGFFSINLLPKFKDIEILEFSHIGFLSIKITPKDLADQNFKIYLKENIQNLTEVAINNSVNLKAKLAFKVLKPLNDGVFSFGSFVKDDKIYVMGGDASRESDPMMKLRDEKPDATALDVQKELIRNPDHFIFKDNLAVYDIKNDNWETSVIKFKKRASHNIFYYDDKIYIVGGKRISLNAKFEYLQDQIEVFDTKKNSITIDKTNPHQASDFASFIYKDNIVLMGGSVKKAESGKKDFTKKVHLYNITSGYWYELAEMPMAKETTGVLVGDKVYLLGGNNGNAVSQIETFDLITEKWQTEGELFSGLERPATAYHDDIIYFFENQKIYTYNIQTKQLKEYEINIELKYAALLYNDQKLYLIGGRIDKNFSKLPSSKVFSIEIDEFKKTRPSRTKILSQQNNETKSDG